MSAQRCAGVPAPRAGPRSLSLAWVEREEGCNKVREFRWLSSKGSLTTPSPTCLSVPFSPLSLSLPCLSASENQSTQKQPCSVSPPLSPLPDSLPPSFHTRLATKPLCRSSTGERGEESSSDGDFHHATGIGAQLSTFDTRTDRDCQAQWLEHVDKESSHRPTTTTSFAASAGAGACECSPSRHGSDGTRSARVGGVVAASRAGTKGGATATTTGGGQGHGYGDERGGR